MRKWRLYENTTATDLSVYACVGIIMLVNLVKKNGIMRVDFAIEVERSGITDPSEAIHRACMVRFRPILMTTMAALLGILPIALGLGAGNVMGMLLHIPMTLPVKPFDP